MRLKKLLPNRWFIVFIGTIATIMALLFFYQISVDAFGVWNGKIEKGYNNYKTGQTGNTRLFKPYEYAQLKPKVVFFGDSRVSYGFPSEWAGIKDHEVYNFGLHAARIPETMEFVKFAISTHHPDHVVIGLGLTNFNAINNHFRKSFSAKRLERTRIGGGVALVSKMSETVLNFDAIAQSRKTIDLSKRSPKKFRMYNRGWNQMEGGSTRVEAKLLRQNFWSYFNRLYRKFEYCQENMVSRHDICSFLVRHRPKRNLRLV